MMMMEEDEYGSRRPRSRNWNTAEKFFLFEHVKNRFDIITDPRKESSSINAKRRVWEQIYQAIAKEFGPLEEHLVRGKGGEKCRTQWKNLVQAARKEYKQYMEAKMVGKRHNMTLLSRKICRLMSIDLDDGLGDQDNEENDWTEDHPEFRYQPELCQELKETARRINEEYEQGVYEATLQMDNNPGDYDEELGSIEDVHAGLLSDSEVNEPDNEKDEDYAPASKRQTKKRRRASSGRSPAKAQPTRTSARAQALQAKKTEEEKKTRKRRSEQQEYAMVTQQVQMGGVVPSALTEQIQQEILNLHLVEHKKRMNLMNTEHKTKMQNLKMEKDIMTLQKEFWAKKVEVLYDSRRNKGRIGEGEDDDEEDEDDIDEDDIDEDDNDEDDNDEDEEGNEDAGLEALYDTSAPGPSGTSALTSVVVPPAAPAQVPEEPPPQAVPEPAAPSSEPASLPPEIPVPPQAPVEVPAPREEERPADDEMEMDAPRPAPPEGYAPAPTQEMPPPPPQNEVPPQ